MHLHDVSTVSVPGCHVSPMLAHQLRVQVQGAPSVPSAFPCVRHAAALHHITLPVESVSRGKDSVCRYYRLLSLLSR
jgi:hypothetical protein